MAESSLTGDGAGDAGLKTYGEPFVGNTVFHDDRCAGYDRADTPSAAAGRASDTRLLKPAPPGLPHSRSAVNGLAPTAAARYAVGRHLAYAKADCEKMVEAGSAGDIGALVESGADLLASLRELWRLRDVREETWGELVNVLQCVLAGQQLEALTQPQCEAIRSYVADYLASGAVDDDLPLQARRSLRQAGFDPWRALAAEDEEDKG